MALPLSPDLRPPQTARPVESGERTASELTLLQKTYSPKTRQIEISRGFLIDAGRIAITSGIAAFILTGVLVTGAHLISRDDPQILTMRTVPEPAKPVEKSKKDPVPYATSSVPRPTPVIEKPHDHLCDCGQHPNGYYEGPNGHRARLERYFEIATPVPAEVIEQFHPNAVVAIDQKNARIIMREGFIPRPLFDEP